VSFKRNFTGRRNGAREAIKDHQQTSNQEFQGLKIFRAKYMKRYF